MARKRITYKALCDLIDEWNESHGLEYRDVGYLAVSNNGETHILTQIIRQGETAVNEVCSSITDGSVRSCYYAVAYVDPPSPWSEESPTEPGFYWLYGETSYGSMGGHYSGAIPPRKELHYVEVQKISNGLMAVSSGHFIPLEKFDAEKRQPGHIGVWQKVQHPELPRDHER